MQPLNSVGPEHMRTFSVLAPAKSHHRVGTCDEAKCPNYLEGFAVIADESTDLGQQQAYFIRHDGSRRFTEERGDLGLTVFTFEAGQRCFSTVFFDGRVQRGHLVRIERPEFFVVREGDHRGNPRGDKPFLHAKPENWLDEFATNLDRVAEARARG